MAVNPASGLTATYNDGANTITVIWTRPPEMTGVDITVNGVTTRGVTATTHTIPSTDIPRIITNRIRQGEAVSNVTQYRISVVAYNDFGRAEGAGFPPVEMRIWNIPGMRDITNTNTAVVNNQTELAAAIADASKTNIVLGGSFALTDWTPVNMTNRRFYGNGHTITINSFAAPAPADIGLFAVIENTGTAAVAVRDLTVNYATAAGGAVIVNSSASRFLGFQTGDGDSDPTLFDVIGTMFGGISTHITGSARMENVLVTGSALFNVAGDIFVFAGGITGLMSGTAQINSCYSSMDLSVNKLTGTTSSVFVGGITGSLGLLGSTNSSFGGSNVLVNNAVVTGDITIKASTRNRASIWDLGGLMVGGIAGYARGVSGTGARLNNAHYSEGAISVTSISGAVFCGGVVGNIWARFATLENSSSSAGLFDIILEAGHSQPVSVGGFAGLIYATATATNISIRNSYADNAIVLNASTGDVAAGGFVGEGEVAISYCYAKGSVSVSADGTINAGGFAGSLSLTQSNIFASGNVSVISTGANDVRAGGLIGSFAVGSNVSLTNSYALGDVFVYKSAGGTITAGGLIGRNRGNTTSAMGTHTNTFAAGSVYVQRNTSGTVHAGGLLGSNTSTTTVIPVQNNVVLGSNVTVIGPGTKNIGRITGTRDTQNNPVFTDNYAFNGMRLFLDNDPNTRQPGEIIPLNAGALTGSETEAVRNAALLDGTDVSSGILRTRSFWQTTLAFPSDRWDFSTVEGRGHPVLRRSPNGPRMGGQ